VIESLVARIESRRQPPAGQPSPVTGGISVLEPVGQQEVDDLVLRRTIAERRCAADIRAATAPAPQVRDLSGASQQQPQRCTDGHMLSGRASLLQRGDPAA